MVCNPNIVKQSTTYLWTCALGLGQAIQQTYFEPALAATTGYMQITVTIITISVAVTVRRSENFEKINFFPIQSGISVYILFHMENVIWNQF